MLDPILLTAAGYDDNKWSAEVVRRLFERNLLGEMSEVKPGAPPVCSLPP